MWQEARDRNRYISDGRASRADGIGAANKEWSVHQGFEPDEALHHYEQPACNGDYIYGLGLP
jgi:hypothetical protein